MNQVEQILAIEANYQCYWTQSRLTEVSREPDLKYDTRGC